MTDFGPTPSSFPVPPPPPPSSARTGPPWENPGAPVQRFIDTMKGALIDPQNTFAQMRREGGLQPPLFYYLLGAAIAVIGQILWHFVGFGGMMALPGSRGAMAGAAAGVGFLFIILPLCYIIGIFLGSLIIHVLLGLFGGQKFPYETTFRTVAYAHGSALPIAFIPACGGLIGGIWGLIVLIIGLAQTQETTIGKSAAAVLVPIVICCGLFAVFFGALAAMFGMAAAGAVHGLQ
jgi:hypothetical protein